MILNHLIQIFNIVNIINNINLLILLWFFELASNRIILIIVILLDIHLLQGYLF